jgi:hypothetical protein
LVSKGEGLVLSVHIAAKIHVLAWIGHLNTKEISILHVSGWSELEEMPSMGTLVSLEVLAVEICDGWCSGESLYNYILASFLN